MGKRNQWLTIAVLFDNITIVSLLVPGLPGTERKAVGLVVSAPGRTYGQRPGEAVGNFGFRLQCSFFLAGLGLSLLVYMYILAQAHRFCSSTSLSHAVLLFLLRLSCSGGPPRSLGPKSTNKQQAWLGTCDWETFEDSLGWPLKASSES